MKNLPGVYLMSAVLVISLAACSTQSKQTTTPKAKEDAPAAPTNKTAADSEERDVSKLDPGAIVPAEKVAELAGGKVLTKPLKGRQAMYVIELTSGDTEDYYLLFSPASEMRATLDVLGPEEKGEKVSGILDEAWLGKASLSDHATLMAVRAGDVALEVRGPRKDVVTAIAKEAVANLPE